MASGILYKTPRFDRFSLDKIDEAVAKAREQAHIGRELRILVINAKSRRSLAQNAYYWGVVIRTLSKATGFETDELHEILKFKFNKRKNWRFRSGDIITLGESTKRMSKDEFGDYIRKIKVWSLEKFGIDIPDPDGMTEEQFFHALAETEK